MALADILAAPDADWVYLAVVELASGTRRWSHGRIVSPRFGSTTYQAEPYLRNPLNLSISINPYEIGSGAGTSVGNIDVMWESDQGMDALARDFWEGAAITLSLGLTTATISSGFYPVFSGMVQDILFDDGRLSMVVRTPGWQLDAPLQTNKYAADGTAYEGSASLKDVPKPLVFGHVKNITPVYVDDVVTGPIDLIYQVNDGAILAVDAVYAEGAALTAATVPDSTNLPGWTPEAGKYQTDLSRGLFRLGSAPAGLGNVTCDARGVVGDADAPFGFPQYVGEIARHIAKVRAGLVDADLDTASFDTLESEETYQIGYYTGTQETTCIALLRKLLDASGAYLYFTGPGKLTVGQMRFRTAALTVSQTEGQGLIRRIRKISNPLTMWKLKLGYDVNWTVQTNESLAAAVRGTAHGDFVGVERRYVQSSLGSAVSSMSRQETQDTFYVSGANAATEATRRLGFWDSTFGVYEIELAEVQFLISVGSTIKIKYPRFGFESGLDLFVLGVMENAATRVTTIQAFG